MTQVIYIRKKIGIGIQIAAHMIGLDNSDKSNTLANDIEEEKKSTSIYL